MRRPVGANPGGMSGPVIVPVNRHGAIALGRVNDGYAGSVSSKRKSGNAHQRLHQAGDNTRAVSGPRQRGVMPLDIVRAKRRDLMVVVRVPSRMPASAEAPQELVIQLCLCRSVPGLRHSSGPPPDEPDAKGYASAQGRCYLAGTLKPSEQARMIRWASLRVPHDQHRAAVPQDTQITPFGRALDFNAEMATTAHKADIACQVMRSANYPP